MTFRIDMKYSTSFVILKTNKNTFVSNRYQKYWRINIALIMHDLNQHISDKCKKNFLTTEKSYYYTYANNVWHFLIKMWVAKTENWKALWWKFAQYKFRGYELQNLPQYILKHLVFLGWRQSANFVATFPCKESFKQRTFDGIQKSMNFYKFEVFSVTT